MNDAAKLRWQCRRGTLELDTLLLRYLDTRYPHATAEEQALFQALLLCEDGDLLDWLLGNKPPASEIFKHLVVQIRAAAKP